MTTPTTTPKREPGYYWVRLDLDPSSVWRIARWSYSSWYLCGDESDWSDTNFAEIDERPITRSPTPAEIAEAVKWANTLEQHSPYIYDRLTPDDVLRLDTLAAAAERAPSYAEGAEAMREAAADVASPGSKPCACITKDGDWWQQNCDCSNSGDLAEAQSWCSERNLADRIRTLPLPEPTP